MSKTNTVRDHFGICPLHGKTCPNYVPPEGDVGAKLLILGEGPGVTEFRTKDPFSGESGELLNKTLDSVGWPREHSILYNSVPCNTSGTPQTPTEADVNTFRPSLIALVEHLKPKVIVAVGNWAMFATMKKKTGIVKLNAIPKKVYMGTHEVLVVPSVHPAYVLRNPAAADQLVAAFKEAVRQVTSDNPSESEIVEHDIRKPDEWFQGHKVVETTEEAEAAVKVLLDCVTVAFDVETRGRPHNKGSIFTIGLCGEKGLAYVFPVATNPVVRPAVVRFFKDFTGLKLAHNAKFDVSFLRRYDYITPDNLGVDIDTMLLAHLLDETRPERGELGLKPLGKVYFAIQPYWMYKIPVEVKLKKSTTIKSMPLKDVLKKLGVEKVPFDLLAAYNARDAKLTVLLYEALMKEPEVKDSKILRVLNEISMPASQKLEEVEATGLLVDQAFLEQIIVQTQGTLSQTSTELYTVLDKIRPGNPLNKSFNWGSPKQVGEVLLTDLRLPVNKTPTGQPATDDDSLNAYIEMYTGSVNTPQADRRAKATIEMLMALRKYRKLEQKLETLENLKSAVGYDNRVHPDFVIAGPTTGRTASRNPNVQNLHRGGSTAEAMAVRDAFVAPEGYLLVDADLSMIELRWGAYFYKEPTMRRLLSTGGDMHTYTSTLAFGKLAGSVTNDERQVGKTANFLLLYGGGANRLAKTLRDSVPIEVALKLIGNKGSSRSPYNELARQLYTAFHKAYPHLQNSQREIGLAFEKKGAITSSFGRIRRFTPPPAIMAAMLTGDAEGYGSPMSYSVRSARSIGVPSYGYRQGAEEFGGEPLWKQKLLRAGINAPVQGAASDTLLLAMIFITKVIAPKYGARVINIVHDSIVSEVPEANAEEYAKAVRAALRDPSRIHKFCPEFDIPLDADVKIGKRWGSLTKLT